MPNAQRPNLDVTAKSQPQNRFRVYAQVLAVALLWVTIGTAFYSWHNQWPVPQAFFYAIDAGMSIGFCTDVREKLVSSRAFTILYILSGAAVVGGALTLFVEDTMESCLDASRREYRQLLAEQAFLRADSSGTGSLDYDEFRSFLGWSGYRPDVARAEEARILRKFDIKNKGTISWADFQRAGGFHTLKRSRAPKLSRLFSFIFAHRIYFAFCGWVCMGVLWGMLKQRWDVVTSMHFAISALATGGLTAPPVNRHTGILPADDAIFVGAYCLFGIPLFALTLSKAARYLVQNHVVAAEKAAIATPLRPAEFDFAKSLASSNNDGRVHLGDFVVLHLLRQGRTTIETIRLLRRQFEYLDRGEMGALTVEDACGAAAQSARGSVEHPVPTKQGGGGAMRGELLAQRRAEALARLEAMGAGSF
jgi:hypothetical protein